MSCFRTFAIAAAMILPSLAFAEPGAGPMHGACKNDIQTLCAGVERGGGRIRDCMRQHQAQISTACKVAIADRMLERSGQRGARAQGTVEHTQQSVVSSGPSGSPSIKTVPQAGN
jgi:hypothetical protein